MICISQILGYVTDSTWIAEIFISNSGGIVTICGNRFSNRKVWIKVCNLRFCCDRA